MEQNYKISKIEFNIKCNKVKFSSEKLALMDIERVKKNIKNGHPRYKDRGKIPIRAYWCKECKAYHLTSKPNLF